MTIATLLAALLPRPVGGGAEVPPLANIAGVAYGTRVRADTQFSAKYAASNAVDGARTTRFILKCFESARTGKVVTFGQGSVRRRLLISIILIAIRGLIWPLR